jgi:hypothetical protein
LREQINDSIFYRIDQELGAKIFNVSENTYISIRKYDENNGQLTPKKLKLS